MNNIFLHKEYKIPKLIHIVNLQVLTKNISCSKIFFEKEKDMISIKKYGSDTDFENIINNTTLLSSFKKINENCHEFKNFFLSLIVLYNQGGIHISHFFQSNKNFDFNIFFNEELFCKFKDNNSFISDFFSVYPYNKIIKTCIDLITDIIHNNNYTFLKSIQNQNIFDLILSNSIFQNSLHYHSKLFSVNISNNHDNFTLCKNILCYHNNTFTTMIVFPNYYAFKNNVRYSNLYHISNCLLFNNFIILKELVYNTNNNINNINNNTNLINLSDKCVKIINNDKYDFYSSNSSIIKYNNNYILISRWITYVLDDYGYPQDIGSKNISLNYLISMDDNFHIKNKFFLTDNNLDFSIKKAFYGTEDIRLFKFNDIILYIGSVWCTKQNTIKISISKIDPSNKFVIKKNIINPSFYNISRNEKNWSLFSIDDKLKVIYSWDPLTICTVNFDHNTLDIEKYNYNIPIIFKNMSGSTNGINYLDEIWFLAHKKYPIKNDLSNKYTNSYFHLFVVLDKNMNIKKYSELFKFENYIVEFSCGFLIEKSDIILTYSTNDKTTKIIKINIQNILEKFNWYYCK